jgi:hypothetical protein
MLWTHKTIFRLATLALLVISTCSFVLGYPTESAFALIERDDRDAIEGAVEAGIVALCLFICFCKTLYFKLLTAVS